MADNGDSASSFTTSDKDLFLYAFVGNSTSTYSSDDYDISDTYVGFGWARSTHIV